MTKDFVPVKQQEVKKKVDFEYNTRTAQSYRKHGLKVPDNLDVQESHFLSLVDTEKSPIERTVTRIVRLRAPDFTTKKRESKEFLVWYEDWRGKNWRGQNWRGRNIAPVADHVEGVYEEQEVEPVLNNRDEAIGHELSGHKTVHYFPFSKENVDKIIASSETTDKNNIIFVVKD